MTTVVGGASGPDWLDAIGKAARVGAVWGLSFDAVGDLYVADGGNNRISVGTGPASAPVYATPN